MKWQLNCILIVHLVVYLINQIGISNQCLLEITWISTIHVLFIVNLTTIGVFDKEFTLLIKFSFFHKHVWYTETNFSYNLSNEKNIEVFKIVGTVIYWLYIRWIQNSFTVLENYIFRSSNFVRYDVELKFNNSFVNILHSNSVTVEGCKMQKILVY